MRKTGVTREKIEAAARIEYEDARSRRHWEKGWDDLNLGVREFMIRQVEAKAARVVPLGFVVIPEEAVPNERIQEAIRQILESAESEGILRFTPEEENAAILRDWLRKLKGVEV